MNKKGEFGALIFVAFLLAVVIVGSLVISLGSGILTYSMDILDDTTSGLGMVGDSNLSQSAEYSIGTLNDVVQMFKWASGILLIFAFLGIIMLASVIRIQPNGFLIGFYLILSLLLILLSIFVSYSYESIYNGADDISLELHEMPVTSFITLYMPTIITILVFIGGIIIFSGVGEGYV